MIAIAGGGTGGHIFPAVSVIEELRRRGHTDFIWIGGRMGKEREWAAKLKVPYYGIAAGKLRRYFSMKNIADVFRVGIGTLQSFFLMLRKHPTVIFSKGGFVSVPSVIAARMLGVPVVAHESDINPGLANRIVSRFSSVMCTSFEKTAGFISAPRAEFTGNPVRDVIKRGDRLRGRAYLAFWNELPVVLVIGGSLGAASINRAVHEMIARPLSGAGQKLPFNLVHQCGAGNCREPGSEVQNYRQFEFIDEEMGNVLAASDLVVSRAGAGALCEIAFMEKPSILIPLSRKASRGEQILNARYFADNGAAVILSDEELGGEALYRLIAGLLEDKEKLAFMGRRSRELCRPDAEGKIADIIESASRR